ncbi:MAG: hypothetical protein F6J86_44440 [Symploca sp. SIO1B1]|nr:hypothetical protein [Symploca sp. SIO1B1]
MNENPSSGATLRPLSVGNVVSAGIRLYRTNSDVYLPLALVAYLWIFIPFYGWAKYYMISGLMSRLAFTELIEQPETVGTARARVKSKLWYFLCVGFQVGIRLLGVYLLGAIAIGLISGIFSSIDPILGAITIILSSIILIVFLIRFFSRFFVAEIPLAIEGNMTGGESVDRSWQLTEEAVGRIQMIAVIAFLVTLPLVALTGYLPNILFLVLAPDFAASGLATLISVLISLVGGILVLPFWQIIKAVVYYDLRSRQEGLDLQLRDRSL